MTRLIAGTAGALVAALAFSQTASAKLLVQVDKTTQRMHVAVDGQLVYDWPVSTGAPAYNTPSGTFRPFRMDIDHHSKEWDDAPMPYSIFFTASGIAVHGTNHRGLGRPLSHGCVRLSVANAATLWNLVQWQNMANTTVVVTGSIPANRPIIADTGKKARPAVRPAPAGVASAPAALAPPPPSSAAPVLDPVTTGQIPAPAILAPVSPTAAPPPPPAIAQTEPMALSPAPPAAPPPPDLGSVALGPIPPADVGPSPLDVPPPEQGAPRGRLFFLFGR